VHVNYQEKVLSMKVGLPKFKDFPTDFGGGGDTLPGGCVGEPAHASGRDVHHAERRVAHQRDR
jgi:hypothetical protein